jgi:hypothetical protein
MKTITAFGSYCVYAAHRTLGFILRVNVEF